MKLVLKVGGNEVTELSTGSSGHDSSLFEDKNDHDKHKDRKRKKRKKGEKQVPGEEKGRKRRRVKVKSLHCFSFFWCYHFLSIAASRCQSFYFLCVQ